jgi:hypothetical protein
MAAVLEIHGLSNRRKYPKEEKEMQKLGIGAAVVVCIMLLGGMVMAQEKKLADIVLQGCEKEVETYCKNVTPGEGRGLACLYAYNDKLSNRCEYALYDASAQLDRILKALSYLAAECRDDLQKYCSSVQEGEGRILNCINKKKDVVNSRCRKAMDDVQLK